jgi:hypothetical protein
MRFTPDGAQLRSPTRAASPIHKKEGPTMLDIFSPLPHEARLENRAAYTRFIAARDGVVDLEKRTLSRREEGMARYAKALSPLRPMDRKLFDAQYASFDPRVAMPPEMLLLLALVKVNAAESFGVNRTYDKVFRRAVKNGDSLELTLIIEETYHTRILLSAAVNYGIEVSAPFRPPAALRALIGGIVLTPEFMSRPLTLAGEVLGTLLFLNLLGKCRELLRHDPELRDSVEERVCEIMVDEIGHISFNRMCLGGAGLAQARMLVPLVAMSLGRTIPELAVLGAMSSGSESDVTALATGAGLPEHVRKASFLS